MAAPKSGRHYFFDMDGTLTQSRTVCTPEMQEAIMKFAKRHDVIIISGADYKQMKEQLPFLSHLTNKMYVLSQSGANAIWGWRKLWDRKLNSAHKMIISEHIRILKSLVGVEPKDPNDLVQDRGGQVSYSILGHNAPKDEKAAYDPDGSKRKALLEKYPLTSTAVMVRIGGTTCLDYTATGWGKRGNIAHLLGINKWRADDCVYVGDQIYPGGNDYEVQELFGWEGMCKVANPQETLDFINFRLAQPI